MKPTYYLLACLFYIASFSLQSFGQELKTETMDTSNIKVPVMIKPVMKESKSITSSYVPKSVAISTQKAVGEIPISSMVSQSGSVVYTVPVEIYPGVRDMQPQLSLMYNHMAGNGVMGMGWNIAGLSFISRGGLNFYYDGKAEGIKMTKDDAFSLDGTRLIKLSSSTTEIKYETEQGNIKATAYLSGNTVKYFKVFFPNGKEGIFGSTAGNTNYLNYPLTTLSDKQGNTITYQYTYTNNKYKITKITYGGASVEFIYTSASRQDPLFLYEAGLKIMENQLLQKIQCKFGTVTHRTYAFSYQKQKNSSVLTQIDYYAGESLANTTSFNPLKFYYGENNNAYSYTSSEVQLKEYLATSPGQQIVRTGTFNYGAEDNGVIVTPLKNPYFQGLLNIFTNEYYGDEKIFLYTGLSGAGGSASPMPNFKTEAGFVDIFCANLDGVSEDEVIKVNNTVSGNYDKVQFKVYVGNISAGLNQRYTWIFNFSTVLPGKNGLTSVHPKFYYTGDFNGDGKMEVLAVSCNNPFGLTNIASKCYLFDLISGTKLYEGSGISFNKEFYGGNQRDENMANNNSDKIYIIDYDGDGRSEICHINATGTHIYKFAVSGSSYTGLQLVASYTGLKRADLADRQLLIGELNGDGKPDFLVSPPSTNSSDYTWAIHYGKGDGQFERTTCKSANNYPGTTFFLQDVNGDGLTDMIKVQYDRFITYIAGDNILPYIAEGNTYTDMTTNSTLFPTDVGGQLLALKDGKIKKHFYPRNDTKEKLLTGAVNSLGVVERRNYEALNRLSNYSKGLGAAFPYMNFKGALYVPESAEKYVNGNLNESVSYRFSNAVIHKQGLGFRGFESMNVYDNIRNRNAASQYDPYNFGVLKREESPFVTNTYTYSVTVAANKTAKVRMTGASLKDNVKNVTITKNFTYDTYGNPTVETTNYGDGIAESVSKTYYNSTSESIYMLGFLTDMTKTTSRSGSSWSERFQVTGHAAGLIFGLKHYANGNIVNTESFSYDARGNNIKKTATNYGSPKSLSYEYAYNNFGRLTSEKNPLGLTTTYVYNTTTGNLTSVKNHKGYSTLYDYDSFRRVIKTTYPEGLVENTTYSWTTSTAYTGLYNIKKSYTNNAKPETLTCYDALNRELRFDGKGVDGNVRKIIKDYDTYGRLRLTTLPHTTTQPFFTYYTYDSYDRLILIAEPSGRKTSYSYSGKNVTTTKDGIASTQYFDAGGNLTSVSDPGGTITYNLRPDGQPTSIVAPGSVTTSFTYDAYGRRLSIVDPSAGTQACTYNAEGNIATERDANNKTITYTYDNYNRTIQKVCPEFTTNYAYNSDGLLTSINSTNSTSSTYTYDAYGRISSEKEAAPDNKFLQKNYKYGTNGELSSIQYTTQEGVVATENYSYQNGGLSEIKLGTTSIWKLNAMNVIGQPTSATTGSFTRTYGYDTYGMPTSRSAGSFQSFSYSFDVVKGNLMSRKDLKTNISESFSYDNLNRLTGFAGKTAGYDVKGNLTSKSNVGTFSYGISGKPYAMSGVTSPSNAIPQRNQTLAYTSFKRPLSIAENNYSATFTYNNAYQRVKMDLKKNNSKELVRYYIGDCYEIDDRAVGGVRQKLYLGGDCYTAPAVYVKDGTGSWQIYYICRDYLGSITHVTNSSGTVTQQLSYDAWGQLRNPANQTNYTPDSEPALFLGRGYTGHEHLPMFGLVNMNARLYDPAVGRFLSPDPYVQAPDITQNFNRYSYCLNNPLRYTDLSGEFFWTLVNALKDIFVNTYIKSWTQGFNAWSDKSNWQSTTMAWKVDVGMYQGNFTQMLSRYTWELPQTTLGYLTNGALVTTYAARSVSHWGGATAVETYASGWGGFTLGSYITGARGVTADPNNTLFQHEYGHYLQSQAWGPSYLSRGALPSLYDTFGRKGDHKFHQIEQDANARAFKYFNEHVNGFYESTENGVYSGRGWNFRSNSLDIFGNGYEGYVDYNNVDQRALVNSLKVNPSVLDYMTGSSFFINPLPTIFYGFRNHVHYNKYKYTIY